MTPAFDAWIVKTNGGGDGVHLILLQFFDAAHTHLCIFCTDFNNVNVFETSRNAVDLDKSALGDAAIVLQSAKEYIRD